MALLNRKEFKIFLTFFIIYLCFAKFQYFDDDVKLDLTRTIIDEHCFEIDSYVENTGGDRIYYNGHYYSDKAPGASFLTIPVYAVFKLFFGMPDTNFKLYLLEFVIIAFSSVLFSALLVVLMYKTSRFFLKKESQRILITIIFGLGTMIFVYSTIYYQHAMATFFAFLCFYLIFMIKQEKKGNYYFLAGLSAGIAFIIDYITITIIIACFIFIIFRKKWKGFLLFFLGFSIFIFVLLIYNNSTFSTPFTLSYYYTDLKPSDNRINKYDEDLVELWKQENEIIEYINFEPLIKKNQFVCVYALTYVNSPEKRLVQIRTGSSGNIKIWLNNKVIIKEEGFKRAIINQDIKTAELNAGWNKFLIKECKYMDDYFELFFVITNDKGKIYHDLEYNALVNNSKNFSGEKYKNNKTKWLIIGPFDYIDENYIFKKKDYFPNVSDKANPPEYEIILNKSYNGKNGLVKWQLLSFDNQKKTKKSYLEQFFNEIPLPHHIYHFLVRLLFYPYRGLFFYNPILILSLIGLFFMYKKNKEMVIFIVFSFILLFLAIILSTWMWWQGSSFGPRFSLLIIPFLILPLMLFIRKLNKNILLIILFICIFINLLGMQEFEQSITVSKWDRANSIGEVARNTMTEYQDKIYSMKPLGNPLFTYYMPLFFKYGPRSILIEQILGFRLFPFLNVIVLMIIVSFIWRKELIRKIKKDFKVGKTSKK